MRVHALLDDASRYVVALRVASNEREETMLAAGPDVYLDVGHYVHLGEFLKQDPSRVTS